jgi:hypothetical protein
VRLWTRTRLISTSWFLVCSSLRAVNSARTSCAGNDLQCTGRNQPSRISWAMLRASLRSVLTGIPLPAKASALRSSLAVPARRCPSTPRAASPSSSPRRSATRTPAWPYRAACRFFVCVEQHQIGELADIEPIHVAAYIEALQATAAKPTAKLHLAAIRMLFDWLVVRSWPTEERMQVDNSDIDGSLGQGFIQALRLLLGLALLGPRIFIQKRPQREILRTGPSSV